MMDLHRMGEVRMLTPWPTAVGGVYEALYDQRRTRNISPITFHVTCGLGLEGREWPSTDGQVTPLCANEWGSFIHSHHRFIVWSSR